MPCLMILWQNFYFSVCRRRCGAGSGCTAGSCSSKGHRRSATLSCRSGPPQLHYGPPPLRYGPPPLRYGQHTLRCGPPPPPWVRYAAPHRAAIASLRAAAQPRVAGAVPAARGGATASGGSSTRDGPGPGMIRRADPGRAGPGKICTRCSTSHSGGSLLKSSSTLEGSPPGPQRRTTRCRGRRGQGHISLLLQLLQARWAILL
jgi:hypothetical protein